MSYATIRARIQQILDTVPSIGNTWDYLRLTKNEQDFRTAFLPVAGNLVRFWEISRRSTTEIYLIGGFGQVERTHVIGIEGYLGVKDSEESEKTFQDLVESVCETFRGKTSLNSLAGVREAKPIQVNTVDHRQFGNFALCHHADLSITVIERISY